MTEQDLIDQGLKEGKKSFTYLSQQIHDNFDWELVHKVMIHTNWEWAMGKDSDGDLSEGIPSLKTIKNKAYRMLKDAYDREGHTSSGGFSAGYEDGELYLSFTLEDWMTGE